MNGKIYKYFNKKKYEEEGIKKYYIGQTTRTIKQRAGTNGSKYLKDQNTKFANAIKKWGWDAFECEILEEGIQTQEELNEAEIKYIAEYDSYNSGYNTTIGGNVDLTEFIVKKVYCPELSMVFNSIKDAANFVKLKSPNNISQACKGEKKFAGKAIINGKSVKLTWKFVTEDELNSLPIGLNKTIKINEQTGKKKVYCPELNMTFDSTEEAVNYIGMSTKGNISKVCKGERKYAGDTIINGVKTKLTWKYID